MRKTLNNSGDGLESRKGRERESGPNSADMKGPPHETASRSSCAEVANEILKEDFYGQGLHRHQRLHQGGAARHGGPRHRHEGAHQGGRRVPALAEAQDAGHDLPAGVHPHPHLLRDGHDRPGRPRAVLRPRLHPAGRPRVHRGLRPRHGKPRRHPHGPRRPPQGRGGPGEVLRGPRDQRHERVQPPHPGARRPHDHDREFARGQEDRGLQVRLHRRCHPDLRIAHVHLLEDGHGLRAVRAQGPSDPRRRPAHRHR